MALLLTKFLVWALIYNLTSLALGWTLKRAFKFPAWSIVAITFNNTTALPLLLVQSLSTSGVLSDLLMGENDSDSDAIGRAKSYFLVCSTVGNCLTFAAGPKLLDDEESPDKNEDEHKRSTETTGSNGLQNHTQYNEEQANPRNAEGRTANEEEEHVNETTTLLPDSIATRGEEAREEISEVSERQWRRFPKAIQHILVVLWGFLNAPLLGAVIGCIVGLTPPLHRVFFNEPSDGGFFKAWLTASLSNVGDLFAALQLVVVGSKLSKSLLKMKMGEASGAVPWIPMLSILFIRFILWPM